MSVFQKTSSADYLSFKKKCVLLFVGTLITVSFVAYNNFPFLYPDSISYIFTSDNLKIPEDRPIFYGFFLRATHLMDNLYLTMVAQSMLLAYVMYLPFRIFQRDKNYGVLYLFALLVLSLCTGYSFYACYIMPDFFGIILFICTLLLTFAPMGKRHAITCMVLVVYSLLVHNANFYIFLFLFIYAGIFIFLKKLFTNL